MKVEFWFEFASTYCYPAAMRVEQLAVERGAELEWKAFLLGPIFAAQGWDDSPFNLYPAKGVYMWRDLERICTEQGIPLRHPSQFPRNGLVAARVACHFQREPWLPAFVRAVYRANLADDRDISDRAVVTDCLEQAGVPAGPCLEAATEPQAKQALRDQTARAVELGILGAPPFVAGSELFWGNDRLEAALDWQASG